MNWYLTNLPALGSLSPGSSSPSPPLANQRRVISLLSIRGQLLPGRGLGDLKKRLLSVQVPDLEPGEVDAVDVVLGSTEIVLRD